MKRFGSVVEIPPENVAEYKRLHAQSWSGVLKMIKECHIQNYSIYSRLLPGGRHFLFTYFEYAGDDFDADMAKMAADPTTQKWWDVCKPLLAPLPDRAPGEFWAGMEEVFHLD